jgi:membrane protein
VYYSAQIYLFGAEFTRVYAAHRGTRVEPAANALPISPEVRARQGMPCMDDLRKEGTKAEAVASGS